MKDIELYRDSFQNFRSYQLPKAQLIIADVPYNLGTKLMQAILHGIRMGIIKTERAILQGKSFLIQKMNFVLPSLCIFAVT